MTTEAAPPRVVWRLLDGRRGHFTQIEGLTRALAERRKLDLHDLSAPSRWTGLEYWLSGRFPPGEGLPTPDLILAAGHQTHLTALAARRRFGGHIVVLMRPSLPLAWFDLCLIPRHDAPPARANVITTHGVLTTVRPSKQHDPTIGLILLGGPSRHHNWNTAALLEQIRQIVAAQPSVNFRIGDSPRTPADTSQALSAMERVRLIPWEQTEPGEIQQMMATAGQVWVSEDSVSMLYESLSSGAPTGLLQVERRKQTRVSRGVDRLVEEGIATPYSQWRTHHQQLATPPALDEAGRCADEILKRWPAAD